MKTNKQRLWDLNWHLRRQKDVSQDPRIAKLTAEILAERAAGIRIIEEKLAALNAVVAANREKRRLATLRWPHDTPTPVIERCKEFWAGTEESRTFRIHAWNEKGIVTGYPGRSYTSGQFRHYGPALFVLISRTEGEGRRIKFFQSWEGRTPHSAFGPALAAL